ncbi:UDP glucuronosyltransferase 5 family, polypeptide D1 [Centroberyx gerrardi]|uniref:UDP glucuronosyltransferase 5 family, polypeptide D1 n=1 Tax=Centroberyx gerrardi TaxID=166262 RepID=UPI003AAB3D47
MKILIEELHARGHSITVIRASNSWYITEESPLYTSINIPQEIAFDNFFDVYLKKHMKAQREQASALTFFKLTKDFLSMISEAHSLSCDMLAQILDDENMVKNLMDSQYDMVLTDPAIAGGVVLAKYLKLPLVLNVRWITSGEGHFAIAPSPLSYVPVPGSGFTDKMNFIQRVQNVLFHSIIVFQQKFMVGPSYDAICDKYFEGGCDIVSLIQETDIWLFRSDFVFDFPRPTMPNVVYMGGFQCNPAQPLPTDLEEFVQSAGEHGVIIMTLGTLVNALPSEVADDIASVFAKMPQKVIWRHIGERPSTLGNNTLLVKWMPQKDLLGHPQIKVFVAHGGTNGVQEAIYHGVPVLGIPLFFDQYDNLLRLQERGGAKIIQLADVNGHSFEQGLKEVLTQDSYRQNMQRLSRLHKDQPIPPMEHAIFWLEYVMRHKGAPHLRTEAYKMPWYSYYSLDVLLVFLTAITVLLLSTLAVFRFLCCRGRRKIKTKQH